ncbi:MAG: winged helix-turn-helix transcriptional regulator [Flavobacteriales bacterium]|nr:winged helix-turn-helix transcriptional regulator [Flavobacteriales bacterium]
MNTLNSFQKDTEHMSKMAKALGHPARLSILNTLAERQECICGEIVDVLPLAQSTVSQHLNDLKKAGLIQGRINGTKSCYCINWNVLNAFLDEFDDWSKTMKSKQPAEGCC